MIEKLAQILLRVKQESIKSGFAFTDKRQNILTLLLQANTPLSAYEIVDRYKDSYGKSIPPMSVYRILDSLVESNFAHKLKTTNQYLACSHITCSHEHGTSQFLICKNCHLISETSVRTELLEELKMSTKNTGFTLASQQLELYGICANCQ